METPPKDDLLGIEPAPPVSPVNYRVILRPPAYEIDLTLIRH